MAYDYAQGRNDGWNQALDNQMYGPQAGAGDSVPTDTTYDQYVKGFSDGVELYNSNFGPDGRKL
jgi:hypothetical protein